MQLVTPMGRAHEVAFAYGPTSAGSFVFELTKDSRPVCEIAREFDGLNEIRTTDDVLGEKTFTGFDRLVGVMRTGPETVDVTLKRGEKP